MSQFEIYYKVMLEGESVKELVTSNLDTGEAYQVINTSMVGVYTYMPDKWLELASTYELSVIEIRVKIVTDCKVAIVDKYQTL